jgi:prophage regulatory protein
MTANPTAGTAPAIPLGADLGRDNHPIPENLTKDFPDGFMRIGEVCKITTLSRSTIYRLAREGEFPAPLKLSQHTSVWEKRAVYGFLAAKKLAAQAS